MQRTHNAEVENKNMLYEFLGIFFILLRLNFLKQNRRRQPKFTRKRTHEIVVPNIYATARQCILGQYALWKCEEVECR